MNARHPKAEPVAQGPACRRRRGHLALAGGLVVAAGLGSRAFPFLVPASLGKYPGDALWATMVLFGLAFLRPAARPLHLAIFALSLSWLVEFSQLYQAEQRASAIWPWAPRFTEQIFPPMQRGC